MVGKKDALVRSKTLSLLVVSALGAVAVACSASDDDRTGGAGGSGMSAGQGETSGQGGASGTGGNAGSGGNGCPGNFILAEGESCSPEGKECDDGSVGPCEFGNLIQCIAGVWVRSESFPDPSCSGAGGD
jgi:hypothetical protein